MSRSTMAWRAVNAVDGVLVAFRDKGASSQRIVWSMVWPPAHLAYPMRATISAGGVQVGYSRKCA